MLTLSEAGSMTYAGDVLDREGVQSAGKELVRVLESVRRPALVLDLSGVVMPTAGGIGELVVLNQRLREMGGRLVLCNVNDRTFEAVAVAGLSDVFEVTPAGQIRS
jgi:anti-anti-sigma factor